MPPKRKGGAAKGTGGKRAKKGPKAKVVDGAVDGAVASTSADPVKDAIAKLKEVDKGKKKIFKPDTHCSIGASCQVHEDYDCMLNQTNIGHNNNKFYIIQVLKSGSKYYTWNRWGRVGEVGANSLKGPDPAAAAVKNFEKKFKDKTKNNWKDRESFNPVAGKYTLIEVEGDETEEEAAATAGKLAKLDEIDGIEKVTADCTLNSPTQSLMNLIFDNDMFKEAMASFDIDVKKMPLGKLSKAQIAKGFDVLEELEEAMKTKKQAQLNTLTSRFYTLIPHNFGRKRPPVIADEETLRQKKDMLLVLADIELAQALQKNKDTSKTETESKEVPHPLDVNYGLLNCDLDHVKKQNHEYKVIEKYLNATQGGRGLKIQDVWRVNRHGEHDRFLTHDDIGNRKLLWHGTNIAVVTAILKSGLRIMPHSGGRVGRGIYFASENAKSACYVRCSRNTGIMFLNEVVLGNEHDITMDNWQLTEPPKGYDSIIARGHTEPDSKYDVTLELEGKEVTVPQGKPIAVKKYETSNFGQSEYLVYKESQNRIRYLLKLKF